MDFYIHSDNNWQGGMKMRTQRTKNLCNKFMEYHEEGFSIYEIADIFDVHYTTVYAYLDEIAKANGVSRESLLTVPHEKHSSHIPFKKEKIDLDKTKLQFSVLGKDIDKLIEKCNMLLS